MDKVTCRLLPFAVADGPNNMAADEVLLQSAQAGQLSLRFYGWSQATVSLGYFQASAAREDPNLRALPFVRRPTGGATLVHHHELTYALALPFNMQRQVGEPWLMRMHRIIASALQRLGVACRLAEQQQNQPDSLLCFQQFTRGDLLLGSSKIVGSAQRRQKGSLLQHGAILLRASPHAPSLAGILEQTGREIPLEQYYATMIEPFQRETAWELKEFPWDAAEQALQMRLARKKYSSTAWNNKR